MDLFDVIAAGGDAVASHTTRTAFGRDRARGNDLTTAGWTILRVTSASTDRQIAQSVSTTLRPLGRFPAA